MRRVWGVVLVVVGVINAIDALQFLGLGVPEIRPDDPTWTSRYYFVVCGVAAYACFMLARTQLGARRGDDERVGGRR
jgi:hypothetical protein